MDDVFHVVTTGSTNEDAYAFALKGAKHGFSVLASTQTAGRGRLGRDWVSPADTGLYCSIILRPSLSFSEFPKISLTAGLALCKVVESLLPDVIFGLKWPNDLYCQERKCGGILVESSSHDTGGQEKFVIVGFGLNVNSQLDDFPVEYQQKVTSLLMQNGIFRDIPELFQRIRNSLLKYVALHETAGFSPILKEWRKRDILLGKEMQWVTRERKLITGVGLGPDESGQLLARDRDGRLHEILSGDVQLAEPGQAK